MAFVIKALRRSELKIFKIKKSLACLTEGGCSEQKMIVGVKKS